MVEKDFRFKRFSIAQSKTAMKVGMDGVLLGAWVEINERVARVLDIGAGTGVIALMLAQRGERWGVNVDGVEIDVNSALQAKENVEHSPWSENVAMYNESVQEFSFDFKHRDKYDLIVSNPPYFNNSLPSPDSARTIARHTTQLSYRDLMSAVADLLSPDGRFAVVLPYADAESFVAIADEHKLQPIRRTDVHTTPRVNPKRVLMEFAMSGNEDCDTSPIHTKLIIESTPRNYTDEYRELTKDFYLKF